jgi:thiamine-phosphate pyrophosphorylase
MVPAPIICYVTDRRAHGGEGVPRVLEVIRSATAAGVDWIQVREKDMTGRALLDLAQQAVKVAHGSTTKILINDRLDAAVAAEASGVHLGGQSAPVAAVKRWCAEHFGGARPFLIGRSCHSLAETRQAQADGADYIFFGPVFATPSKMQSGAPQGTERLAEVCREARVPVIAIGGINEENARECLRAGAAGMAAIRLFQEAVDLVGTMRRIRALAVRDS